MEARIRLAIEEGELPRNADAKTLAGMAAATLYALPIRAPAGVPRPELEDFEKKMMPPSACAQA